VHSLLPTDLVTCTVSRRNFKSRNDCERNPSPSNRRQFKYGVPPGAYATPLAVTSLSNSCRQRRDIQLDTGSCRGRYNQTTGNRPSQDHVTDTYTRGTGGTVLLSHRWCHTHWQLHREKTKTGPRSDTARYDHPHHEGAHRAVTKLKPTHWRWDRPPDGNQPRLPGCHICEASACSTLQLTG